MATGTVHFTSIDEYITSFPEDTQKILADLRATIHAAAPDAEEKISYNMPTFTLNGKYLTYFAAWKNHIAIYGTPPVVLDELKEVVSYKTEKGALQFPLDQPLPLDLITKLVELSAIEHQNRRPGKPKKETVTP